MVESVAKHHAIDQSSSTPLLNGTFLLVCNGLPSTQFFPAGIRNALSYMGKPALCRVNANVVETKEKHTTTKRS
jgi:hypothetical protein